MVWAERVAVEAWRPKFGAERSRGGRSEPQEVWSAELGASEARSVEASANAASGGVEESASRRIRIAETTSAKREESQRPRIVKAERLSGGVETGAWCEAKRSTNAGRNVEHTHLKRPCLIKKCQDTQNHY
jgi:hypothetical protein